MNTKKRPIPHTLTHVLSGLNRYDAEAESDEALCLMFPSHAAPNVSSLFDQRIAKPR